MSDNKSYYGIPLSNGRDAFVHIPRGVSQSDITRVIDSITNMADVLIDESRPSPRYLEPRKTGDNQ